MISIVVFSAGLVKLQDLIRTPPDMDIDIALRQGSPDTFRHVLKEIKSREIFNLLVDTKAESMPAFLRAVSEKLVNRIEISRTVNLIVHSLWKKFIC